MVDLRPFRALRPRPDRAAAVLAPPYDVVDVTQARSIARGNPDSFLHVSRPEIDLGAVDPDEPAVHEQAARALHDLVDRGVLVLDEQEAYAVYRLTRAGRSQTGLVACVAVADYRAGRVATHEQTRRDKEDDRVHHVEALGAHDEPVLLLAAPVDPGWAEVHRLLRGVVAGEPWIDVIDPAGVRHELWVVTDTDLAERVTAATHLVPALYVADGHHRSAAADRVAGRLDDPGADPRRAEFPVVVFPGEELLVLPYNRVVADLGDRTEEEWLAALAEVAGAPLQPYAEGRDPAPSGPGEVSVRAARRWWRLPLAVPTTDRSGDVGAPDADGERMAYRPDPVAVLDVSLLQDRVLGPLLGITDPRGDPRIGFVGGVHGVAELERLVDDGPWASAVLLHPTGVDDLVAVAGSGRDMPPKSTWFEPKLGSGLFVHPFTAAYD